MDICWDLLVSGRWFRVDCCRPGTDPAREAREAALLTQEKTDLKKKIEQNRKNKVDEPEVSKPGLKHLRNA